jgi:RecB family exonuclease
VWQANGATPLLPISPSARLGSVAHRVLEISARGRVKAEDLAGTWDEAVSRIEEEMRRHGEAHLVPLSENAPRYEVKKRLTLDAAAHIVHNLPSGPRVRDGVSAEAEVWLESRDKLLGGFVDRLVVRHDGTEIIDYKTGAITEEGTGKVKRAYEVQLLLYAALYHDERGAWPARLTLRSMSGENVNVQLDPASAIGLLVEARAKLSEINELVAKDSEPDALARPSAVACANCGYRPVCGEYWREKGPMPPWPTDVAGKLTEVTALGNGTLRAVIETGEGIVAVRGLSPERFEFLRARPDRVILCNLKQDEAEGCYVQTRMTKAYYEKS